MGIFRAKTDGALTKFCAIALCVAINCLSGCDHGPDTSKAYGRNANPNRKSKSIPIIPSQWTEQSAVGQAVWANPRDADPATTHDVMHSYKETFTDRKTGLPLWETDYYKSGKQYYGGFGDPQDKYEEELGITYDFRAARQGKDPWRCQVNTGPHYHGGDGTVSFAEANEMLKEWGIDRLNGQ